MLTDEVRSALVRQLGKDAKKGLGEYRLAIEHVENIKRIHTLARRIARAFIDMHTPRKSMSTPSLPAEP